jgi:hypothetical protein
LIGAPEHFYINPRTGVVIATFTPDDVTIGRSSGGVANKDPLTVTLQAIADTGDRRAVVEVYSFHIKDREIFKLVRGSRVIDERFRKQYIADENDAATIVVVHTPFRIAARRVNQNKTTLSGGGFGDIRYTFKVFDTATGDQIDAGMLSITSSGELLGEFYNAGKFAIVVTATDGGGANLLLDAVTLDVRQRDVDVPSFGPTAEGVPTMVHLWTARAICLTASLRRATAAGSLRLLERTARSSATKAKSRMPVRASVQSNGQGLSSQELQALSELSSC